MPDIDTEYQITVVSDGDDVVEPFDYTDEMKGNPAVLSKKVNEIISKHQEDNKSEDEDEEDGNSDTL
jgi:hypothetical protein